MIRDRRDTSSSHEHIICNNNNDNDDNNNNDDNPVSEQQSTHDMHGILRHARDEANFRNSNATPNQ